MSNIGELLVGFLLMSLVFPIVVFVTSNAWIHMARLAAAAIATAAGDHRAAAIERITDRLA